MKRSFVLFSVLAFFLQNTIIFAQSSSATEWLKEINKDIWLPFLEGVEKNNDSLYLKVHSKDYIRVQEEGRLLLGYLNYIDDTRTMMQRYKDGGTQLTMQIRFEDRITNGQVSFERGISKVVFTSKTGEFRTFYSRFHATSRKENGVWRILTEYFTRSDGRVDEEQFKRAYALDDVSPFRCYMEYPGKKMECGKQD